MLIVMGSDATPEQIKAVSDRIRELGFTPNEIPGAVRIAIGVTGNKSALDPGMFNRLPGVQDAVVVSRPYKLVSREVKPDDTIIEVRGTRIGGGSLTIMAGPCSVESREQTLTTARHVRKQGATVLRGGARFAEPEHEHYVPRLPNPRRCHGIRKSSRVQRSQLRH